MSSKRGRPPVFSEESIAIFRNLFPDLTTRRGLTNKAYEIHALGVLNASEAWKTFYEPFFLCKGGTRFKSSLLCELGRLRDEGLILEIARQVVELANTPGSEKTTVREWTYLVKFVRRDILGNGFPKSEYEEAQP